jgi:hypothetical protein
MPSDFEPPLRPQVRGLAVNKPGLAAFWTLDQR